MEQQVFIDNSDIPNVDPQFRSAVILSSGGLDSSSLISMLVKLIVTK